MNSIKTRFEKSDFHDPSLREQLSAIIAEWDYFERHGKQNEFNSILINLGRAYPSDTENVFALFGVEKSPKPVNRQKTVNPAISHKGPPEGGGSPRWGEYKRMGRAERIKRGLDPDLDRGDSTEDLNADVSPKSWKTVEDVMAFFDSNGIREYAEIVSEMRSYAENRGINVGSRRKPESIAEAIIKSQQKSEK